MPTDSRKEPQEPQELQDLQELQDATTLGLGSDVGPQAPNLRFSLLLYSRDGLKVFPLMPGRPVVIGRQLPADAPLRDESVSRQHARFAASGEEVWLEDLGSTNGTRVNGEKIERTAVRPGDEIVLGSVVAAIHALPPIEPQIPGLLGHDQLQVLLEAEVARASFFGRQVALVMVREVDGAGGVGLHRWYPRVHQLLRPVDHLALYGPRTLEILVPEPADDPAQALAQAIVEGGEDEQDPALVCGVALFPGAATSPEELIAVCRRALERADGRRPVQRAPVLGLVQAAEPDHLTASIGERVVASPAMEAIDRLIDRLAPLAMPVLICGETGTGKELIARAIHDAGPRRGRPLMSLNCASIPPGLTESVLFGHEKGAFTGATERAAGLFEQGAGGTVFLDEIGELSPKAQAALLRVLESKRIRRVGGPVEIEVDCRVVAATHRDLETMCEQGAFRWDLLYRLNAVTLQVPPLRDRPEEIGPLAQLFLQRARGSRQLTISPDAMATLSRYGWPGNIRQLRNVIERAAVLARGEVITVEELPERVRTLGMSDLVPSDPNPRSGRPQVDDEQLSFRQRVQRFEAALLLDALDRSGWNQAKAARLLGTTPRAVYHKCGVHELKSGSPTTERLRRELAPLLGLTFADEEGQRAPFKEQVRRYEIELIEDALQATGFNKAAAARQLRMPLRTLLYKVSNYAISEP